MYISSISKNVYINRLNDIVDKYSNASCKATKMKPVDVKSSIHTELDFKENYIDRKFS